MTLIFFFSRFKSFDEQLEPQRYVHNPWADRGDQCGLLAELSLTLRQPAALYCNTSWKATNKYKQYQNTQKTENTSPSSLL